MVGFTFTVRYLICLLSIHCHLVLYPVHSPFPSFHHQWSLCPHFFFWNYLSVPLFQAMVALSLHHPVLAGLVFWFCHQCWSHLDFWAPRYNDLRNVNLNDIFIFIDCREFREETPLLTYVGLVPGLFLRLWIFGSNF